MLAERQNVATSMPLADMPSLARSYPVPAVLADACRVFIEEGLTLRGEFSGCENLAIAGQVESDVVMQMLDIHEP
ncbi:MAG TPA: hypothetical protein VHZ95_02750, partial [Polyangiales bacterium]|nr:hypothetical protein [Polyangiales bacterium]